MEIKVPRIAEGVATGTVVGLLVSVGEMVAKDQPVIELETEKAIAPIPSPYQGKVATIHVKAGDKVSVGQTLITLVEEGETVSAPPSPSVSASLKVQTPSAVKTPVTAPALYTSKSGFPPPAAPVVKRLARKLGVDLAHVPGRGRGGRILLEDVQSYLRSLGEKRAEQIDFSVWGPIHKEPFTTLRQKIAEKMSEAWITIPHVTQFDSADLSHLLHFKEEHAGVTVTALLLQVMVQLLKRHPKFNASLDEVTNEVIFKDYYHLGIAVDTDQGLIVPVLRNVGDKPLSQLATELKALAKKARERKLSLEELQGGTFTLSNQGGIGGGHFTPIVYHPQVAILGVGETRSQAVVKEDRVVIAPVLPLALSYDHRLIDGADAARFMKDLVNTIEHFLEKDVLV